MEYENCCGAVIFTRDGGEIKYLIIQNLDGIYGFPKGHMEKNESERETALREIFEEVHIKVNIIDGFKTTDEYFVPNKINTMKKVVYFLGEFANQELIIQNTELSNAFLTSFEKAIKLLQFESLNRILNEANEYLINLNNWF